MNQTLYEIAYGMYRSWFIDFEPIHNKTAGASSYPSMPSVIFDQLPSAFEESEIGLVPHGWTIEPLSGLVNLVGGGTPKRKVAEYWDGDVPWFSVRDAPDDTDVWVLETQESITQAGVDNSSANIMRAGTTIISARGTVGRLALTATPMAMNQSCYGAQGRHGVGDYFVYFTLRAAVAELKQRTHGSVFDTITRSTFDGLFAVRPPRPVLDAFERAVSPLVQRILANRNQDRTLAAIRDTSLDELVSGSLRLPIDAWGLDVY